MQNLTLQQLFGVNATQDSQSIIIHKADLPKLTPSIDNRAEQLLAGILLRAWNEFEGLLVDERGNTIVDETSEAIGYDQREAYEKLNIWLWKRQFARGKVINTFVIDVFINPPPSYGTPLSASQL